MRSTSIAPILYDANGPSASLDQRVVPTTPVVLSALAALVLRLVNWQSRKLVPRGAPRADVPFGESRKRNSDSTALKSAFGKYTIIQDADLECDPRDYTVLLWPLLLGTAEVVFGSRYLAAKDVRRKMRWLFWSRGGVCILNFVVWLLYGARLSDEACCYKVLPTLLLRNLDLECERFEICPEVTAKVIRTGLRIHEVSVCYHRRGIAEGKKLRFRDGFFAIATLWKFRKWRPLLSAALQRPSR